ncbi:MAG: undecaprenyl-diphosphate phosphatase [Patescibacteria group bacterium]|jgi:undecaprenyl-diphosphatase
MDIFYSIIFAIVQGITEFLPVSSSGHLIILHDIFDMHLTSDLAFDVALHAGTFFAILIYFYRDLVKFYKTSPRTLVLICMGAIPAGVVGYFLEDFIDSSLRSLNVIIVMLVAVGVLLIVAEKYHKPLLTLKHLTWQQTLTIGIAQIFALVPGTSRSGITIIAGIATNLKRREAAEFAFLIGLPIFGLATLKKVWDLSQVGVAAHEWTVILIGFFVSGVVGFFVIKYLLKFLDKYSLKWFAYYRFALAFVLIIYLLIKPA